MGFDPRRRAITRYLPQVAVSVAVIAYTALGLYTEFWLMGQKPLPATLLEDFGYYTRAFVDATHGADPYQVRSIGTAFLYPPPALFIIGVFAQANALALRAALYTTLNLSLLALLVWGVARRYGLGVGRVWWWYPLAFAFGPTLETLHVGQINVVTEFGVFLVFVAAYTAPVLAGFGLGMAASTKVVPIILLAYLFASRNFRALGSTIAWLFIMVAGSGIVFGWRHLLTYVDVFERIATTLPAGDGNTLGLTSVLLYHHLIGTAQAPSVHGWHEVFFGGLFLCSAGLTYLFRQSTYTFLIMSLGMVASPSFVWYHHWVFLLLPVFVWIAFSDFRPAVVIWCFVGLSLIQIDRWWWTRGLLAHAFVHVSILVLFLSRRPTR